MIKLIWAMDKNGLIGKGNKLPWHYPEDLKYFKDMTTLKNVLMGKNTYDSLKGYYGKKQMPFGPMFVLNKENETYYDAIRVSDLDSFLQNNKDEDFWIIGGRMIYEATLKYADQLHITYIDAEHDGDVFFPEFDLSEYKLIDSRESGILTFKIYERIRQI